MTIARSHSLLQPAAMLLALTTTTILLLRTVDAFAPSNNNILSTTLRRSLAAAGAANTWDFGLLFDCDGVILQTEELHRLAYNAAFDEFGLTIDGDRVEWSVDYYEVLQNTIGGGKPKMFHFFRNTAQTFPHVAGQSPPTTPEAEQKLVDDLQSFKTGYFQKMLATKATPRPGVLALMDAALADPRVAVGVCSASTKEAAQTTLSVTLGPERVEQLDVCLLGDDVPAKKPSPLIYDTARETIGLEPHQCIVIEDSLVGLQSAKGANMSCLITYTASTEEQDFSQADAKVPNLADVRLEQLLEYLQTQPTDGTKLSDIVGAPGNA